MQAALQNIRTSATVYAERAGEQQRQHEKDVQQCADRVHELQGELHSCRTDFGNQNLQIQEMMKVLQQIPEAEKKFENLSRRYLSEKVAKEGLEARLRTESAKSLEVFERKGRDEQEMERLKEELMRKQKELEEGGKREQEIRQKTERQRRENIENVMEIEQVERERERQRGRMKAGSKRRKK